MPTTGQLIREARIQAKLSQGQLAARLEGVSRFLVSHWEADRKRVTDLPALAEALGVLPEVLIGDELPSLPAPEPRPARRLDLALEAEEPFISLACATRILSRRLGMKKVHPYTVYRWVAEKGLPAWQNPLRVNQKDEPTLLFRESQLTAWLDAQIQPLALSQTGTPGPAHNDRGGALTAACAARRNHA